MALSTIRIGFIATFVRDRSKCEIEIADPVAQGMNINQILGKAEDANIIGLNCFTERRFQCFDLAKKLKI